jgi:hypothetical protein
LFRFAIRFHNLNDRISSGSDTTLIVRSDWGLWGKMAGERTGKLREINGGAAIFGATWVISERGSVEEAAAPAPIAFPEFPEFARLLMKF